MLILVVFAKELYSIQSVVIIQSCLNKVGPGNTKGESITVPLTSCLTGLESADKFCFKQTNPNHRPILIQTSQIGGQRYGDTFPL
jgi:hypothetical protein